MKLIDALREIDKSLISLINPDWIRLDIFAKHFRFSAHSVETEILARVDFAGSIEGPIDSFVIQDSALLKAVLSSSDFKSISCAATYIPRQTNARSNIIFHGSNNSSLKLTVWQVDHPTVEKASCVGNTKDGAQLLFPIDAYWKAKFEYWSKVFDESDATFFHSNGRLYCMIGDNKFDYLTWYCEEGDESRYISAIKFPCKPVRRVLAGYATFKRLSISVSASSWMRIDGETDLAKYQYYIIGDVPYWYHSMRSPIYDIEDPRSVLNQRQDGG